MNILLQIALIIIPTGAVLYMAFLFLNKQSEKDNKNLLMELRKERQSYFLPSRVDACQRLVLLLERIHPNNLVMRVHNPVLSAKGFQAELLKSIREEYDHNVAQQLFVSPQAWSMIQDSKDETVKIINIAAGQVKPDANGTELAGKIFELVGEVGKMPSEFALDFLKKELQELF
jgi:hypothetical protein